MVERSTVSLKRVWHAKRADDRRERRTSSLTLWVLRNRAAQGAARGRAALGGLCNMRGMGAVPGRDWTTTEWSISKTREGTADGRLAAY